MWLRPRWELGRPPKGCNRWVGGTGLVCPPAMVAGVRWGWGLREGQRGWGATGTTTSGLKHVRDRAGAPTRHGQDTRAGHHPEHRQTEGHRHRQTKKKMKSGPGRWGLVATHQCLHCAAAGGRQDPPLPTPALADPSPGQGVPAGCRKGSFLGGMGQPSAARCDSNFQGSCAQHARCKW